MLKEFIRSAPPPAETMVRVKILSPIRVAGPQGAQECDVGTIAAMSLSDAQALRNSSPPSVEIIK